MSKYDKKLREQVYERDSYLCRVCGRQAHHIHHIVYRSHLGSNDIRNLIALCTKCHTRSHSYGRKWVDILIGMQEEIYGHIDRESLMKKSKYKNFKYNK